MLGVSRGTLRTALRRLAETGEIVRRQGSGTFVGRIATPGTLSEGLERLESYSSLAERRGVQLSARDVEVAEVPAAEDVAASLGVDPGTEVLQISRVLVTDGRPTALMVDSLHPATPAPDPDAVKAVEDGLMVLDVLVDHGSPIAWADTRIRACIIDADDPRGRALGLQEPTALLSLDELYFVTGEQVTHHSRDLFLPDGIDLRVTRWMEARRPLQVAGTRDGNAAPARRNGRRTRRR